MDPNTFPQTFFRLPRGEHIWYNKGRANIRRIVGQIQFFGYDVWYLHVDIPGFQQQDIPREAWLHTILIGRTLLLVAPPLHFDEYWTTSSAETNSGTYSLGESE